jgi:UDP-glucose 4-epimerase
MTLLVTGSAGHLGEALMRSLCAANRSALGVDVKASGFTDRVGTILDREFVRECMSRNVDAVIHAATLHKPHLATHRARDFIDTNVTGTLILLEEALAAAVKAFVFTSTTSAFGAALRPPPGEPAVWVTEKLAPVSKNIYGVTKLAAESLCELFSRRQGLPVIVLRTSRFFPEPDDDPDVRGRYHPFNVQANEMLHRRADIEDVVSAHLLAVDKAPALRFGRYIISATTPFSREDRPQLRRNAPGVVHRLFPDCRALFAARRWTLFRNVDRVYVNQRARRELGWWPKYDFAHVLDCLRAGRDFHSALAREVGSKGYHDVAFDDGPYPVA